MFHIKSKKDYERQYQLSLFNPGDFWLDIAQNFSWFKTPKKSMDCDLKKARIKWFEDGKTNIAYNCLDRHLSKRQDQTAIIWEPNDPKEKIQKLTYKQLFEQTCQFANLLIARGVKKGDRVCIYMPMVPQAIVAMLACARIGAVHCVVFAGFSAKALAGRIEDSGAKILITSDELYRGDKTIELFEIASEALESCPQVKSVILYKRGKKKISDKRITVWQDEILKFDSKNEAVESNAEDPLFILYTSGSTGKPKGILHTVAGYMVYVAYSFKNVFQYRENEVFFCTADIGWITGHSYSVYGPLLNGAKILMFEGIPTYPTAARFWEVIEKHRVNIFYTAPTAIRSLMQSGNQFLKGHDLSSLRVLGSVGEPINEEAWNWYFEKIGGKKCPITDTWWQTETGGIMISALAGVTKSKSTHAGFPLPGIVPVIMDDSGKVISRSNKVGNLCFKQPWPGMARDVWGNRKKFIETYYHKFPGLYLAGDGAYKTKAGSYRIIGRVDDVIKVSGHRLGTAEIENAINSHQSVSESAVIGFPHKIKGEGIAAFVISKKSGIENAITKLVRDQIGPIATPDKVFVVKDLPKTRSGKIMRRILKKIIVGEKDFGDTSTLVNPDVINQLKEIIHD